jgi:hypothetical protein
VYSNTIVSFLNFAVYRCFKTELVSNMEDIFLMMLTPCASDEVAYFFTRG